MQSRLLGARDSDLHDLRIGVAPVELRRVALMSTVTFTGIEAADLKPLGIASRSDYTPRTILL